MLPVLLPSVVEEVFDFPLPVCVIVAWVQLLQEFIAPEKVTPETAMPNAIPYPLVSAMDPTCHLSCHALGIQIKQHHVQNRLQASDGSGVMYMSHSQQTQPLNSIQVFFL